MDATYEMPNAEVSSSFPHHFSDSTVVAASQPELFAFIDRHAQLSAHMTRRSWMMGGGRMTISTDEGGFRRLGSRLRLAGRVFGLALILDEKITEYQPPRAKIWRTVGTPRLLIIGSYRMGFEITPAPGCSRLRVFLDYQLPTGVFIHFLSVLLAPLYARWCVRSMIAEANKRFSQHRVQRS